MCEEIWGLCAVQRSCELGDVEFRGCKQSQHAWRTARWSAKSSAIFYLTRAPILRTPSARTTDPCPSLAPTNPTYWQLNAANRYRHVCLPDFTLSAARARTDELLACISCTSPIPRTRPSASTRLRRSSMAKSARARTRLVSLQTTSTQGIASPSRRDMACS